MSTLYPGGSLVSFSQGAYGSLTLNEKISQLPSTEFAGILDQMTRELEHFQRAIEFIGHEELDNLLGQILEAFTLKIGKILKAERVTIFLVDRERGELTSKVAEGTTDGIRIPYNAGIAGYVACTGDCLNITDPYSDPRFNREIDDKHNFKTRSILCMPIFSKSDPDVLNVPGEANQPDSHPVPGLVAVAQLINKIGDDYFVQEDEEEFSSFAHKIGVILESCQAFYMAARAQRGFQALMQATLSLSQQGLDLNKTLDTVIEEARKLMKADRGTLFLLDEEHQQLWAPRARDQAGNLFEIRIPHNAGIAGHVASTGETLNIADAYADSRFDPSTDNRSGYHTRNILCMPVFSSTAQTKNGRKKVVAVTQLLNKENGPFTNADEELLSTFSIQAGVALENAQLFETIKQEKQYQLDILGSLSDAVISTDKQGYIETVNPSASELLGLKNETTIGLSIAEVIELRTNDGQVSTILDTWFAADPDTRIRQYHPEQTLGTRSVHVTLSPLKTTQGRVRGGLVVMEDFSQEKRMKTALVRYVSQSVADQLLKQGADALMKGERRTVTVLFSDIRDYTRLTETMGPDEVVSMLNAYFDRMVDAVMLEEGTLDKFIGDAVMAVFGAPLAMADHACRAVKAALRMRAHLREFNQERVQAGKCPIRIGIGLSSGEVVSGDIGSQKRTQYTAIGDGVNLSSRLESASKNYGCDIVLSEYTYQDCKDIVQVRELDRLVVKGKTQAVTIYELLGAPGEPLSKPAVFLDAYFDARQLYLRRQFDQAIQAFEQAQPLCPEDKTVKLYLDRCQYFLANPPSEDWQGEWIMTGK
ncbi:GAF domain-containing protein [Leptolyngbya sp. FACHB-261]|uniref:GAF domain-containing protein n=1 Tax=Leptolyngbya sp. FACHB-261 TaxID=2692806 RepID=UPI001685BF47|nr:adenylate/guanylate cyclase domain-containing protein [Leptolyngbya sp. FACHB-261]MBD2104638.1 GAF domain-containing protein [Leptolyngbya sp. FACHB-261]